MLSAAICDDFCSHDSCTVLEARFSVLEARFSSAVTHKAHLRRAGGARAERTARGRSPAARSRGAAPRIPASRRAYLVRQLVAVKEANREQRTKLRKRAEEVLGPPPLESLEAPRARGRGRAREPGDGRRHLRRRPSLV